MPKSSSRSATDKKTLLVCHRFDSANAPTLTKLGFLQLCKKSYIQATTLKRVQASLKCCAVCEIGKKVAADAEVFPENIEYLELSSFGVSLETKAFQARENTKSPKTFRANASNIFVDSTIPSTSTDISDVEHDESADTVGAIDAVTELSDTTATAAIFAEISEIPMHAEG